MRTRISRSRAGASSTPRAHAEQLTRRWALLLAAAPIALFALPGGVRADDTVTLPVQLDAGGRPTVLVQVRGHSLRFLVDTGSTTSVLDRSVADELALDLRRSNITARGLGGPLPAELAVGFELELDGLVSPRGHKRLWVVRSGGFGPGIAGLLGNEFLWDWDVEFDLPAGVLRFHPPGDAPSFVPMQSAQLRYSDRYRGIVQIELNSVVLRALLDSGAAFSSVARRALPQLGIDPDDGQSTYVGMTRGIDGRPIRIENRRFRSFAFEGEQIDDLRLGILDDVSEERGSTGSRLLAETDHQFVLGADWLNAHRVLLAPSRDRLLFTRVTNRPVFRVPVAAQSG
jgi:predicted aspartyl protease